MHGSATWLPFVQPFGTVLLGLAASALAYRQWLTANEKLKLDLYDKRSRWLDEATKNYIEVFRHGAQEQDGLRGLYYHLGRMDTVFPKPTREIIGLIKSDVGSLIGVRETSHNFEKLHDVFQRIVDIMPKLQDAALADMRIDVPSVPWK